MTHAAFISGEPGRRAEAAWRAALLYGPEDLRVEDVAEPEGEVIVEVQAATTRAAPT